MDPNVIIKPEARMLYFYTVSKPLGIFSLIFLATPMMLRHAAAITVNTALVSLSTDSMPSGTVLVACIVTSMCIVWRTHTMKNYSFLRKSIITIYSLRKTHFIMLHNTLV